MSDSLVQTSISISLGKYRLTTSTSGYSRLTDFYHACQNYSDTTIKIDFSELEWFDANLSAVLFSMIYLLNEERGLTFSIDMNYIQKNFEILMRNGFLDRNIVSDSSKSSVKLQAFDQSNETSFIEYVENDLFGNGALKGMSIHLQKRMIQNLLEVFANVSHARTDHPIFACGQYYKSEKRMKFTLVDLGVGYYEPIRKHTNGKVKNSQEAIEWAVTAGTTTNSTGLGGNGLSDLVSYCKESSSHLSIITGGVFWGTDMGMLGVRTVPLYCGTVMTVDFNCN